MKKLLLSTLLAAAAILPSCNSDEPEPIPISFIDIVTLESSSPTGSTFTFRKIDDSPLITLTSNNLVSTGDSVKRGLRLIMQYSPQSKKQYESGPVTIMGLSVAFGEGKQIKLATPEQTHNWASDNITVNNMWRSGEYLNLGIVGRTESDPRQYCLLIDSVTMETPVPEAHIIFEGTMGSQYAQQVLLYASYDISNIWNNPKYTGLKVIAYDGSSKTISKGPSSLQPVN